MLRRAIAYIISPVQEKGILMEKLLTGVIHLQPINVLFIGLLRHKES
jgi:hypothetical protein